MAVTFGIKYGTAQTTRRSFARNYSTRQRFAAESDNEFRRIPQFLDLHPVSREPTRCFNPNGRVDNWSSKLAPTRKHQGVALVPAL
jgi:hypothetical protein